MAAFPQQRVQFMDAYVCHGAACPPHDCLQNKLLDYCIYYRERGASEIQLNRSLAPPIGTLSKIHITCSIYTGNGVMLNIITALFG